MLGERVPATVWALTAFHVALLLAASLVFPAFRPPDEAGHVDLVLHARRTWVWPDYDEARLSAPVVAARERIQGGPIVIAEPPRFTAEDAPARGSRPTFGDLTGEDGGFTPTDEPNQLANHPPLYYLVTGAASAALSAIVGLLAGPLDLLQSVWLMRLVSIAMVAPLPLLAWATARRVGAEPPVAVAAAALPLAIPQLTHIGAAVNNDDILTLAFGVLTLLLVAVWDGDVSPRTAMAVGAVGAASLLSKGFALVLPPWIAAAYLAAWWRSREAIALGAGALALGVAAVGGGWWWLRNLLVFGAVQPAVSTVPPAGPDFEPRIGEWWAAFRIRMLRRFWGQFGYFDARLPRWMLLASTWVSFGAVVTAYGAAGRAGRPRGRSGAGRAWVGVSLLVYPLVTILALVAWGAWRAHVRTGLTPGIQGRYLFPGVVGGAVVVALGLAWVFRGAATRVLPALVLAWAVAMQWAATVRVLRAYWGPEPGSSVATSLRAVGAWAPWPAPFSFTIATLVVVTGAAAVAAAVLGVPATTSLFDRDGEAGEDGVGGRVKWRVREGRS